MDTEDQAAQATSSDQVTPHSSFLCFKLPPTELQNFQQDCVHYSKSPYYDCSQSSACSVPATFCLENITGRGPWPACLQAYLLHPPSLTPIGLPHKSHTDGDAIGTVAGYPTAAAVMQCCQ